MVVLLLMSIIQIDRKGAFSSNDYLSELFMSMSASAFSLWNSIYPVGSLHPEGDVLLLFVNGYEITDRSSSLG